MARILRFAIVGAICVLLNLVVLYFGTGVLALDYLVSLSVSFAVVNWAGFLLNKYFTFRDRRPQVVVQALRYYVVLGVSFAANLTLMAVLVDGLGIHYLVASVIITALFAALNFLGHLRITFAPSGK